MIMEILSTGQKIKRERIYKGLTLKDICDSKISVSKLSCIENDKIKPDDEVIEIIARKLGMDSSLLKQGTREQIENNLEMLGLNQKRKDYEGSLEYNLKYAEEYGYFDLAFEIMHRLFNYYLDQEQIEKLQLITSKYYDYWQKSDVEKNEITYYMDTARYFYKTSEYLQAASYYNNVRRSHKETPDSMIAKATYNEAACYVMIDNYERAYEIAVRLIDLSKYLETDLKQAGAYHMLAFLSLRMDNGRFQEYEKKSRELYGDQYASYATALHNYSVIMFEKKMTSEGVEYIKKALSIFPQDSLIKYVAFMLMVIEELVKNDVLELAQSICDEALNYAITIDNIKHIERAYYYKAVILQKQDNLYMAEMYMNLSFDALKKFGNNSQIHKRYMELGQMYHKMGNVMDSIKYFTLAINLEKKI